MHWSYWRKMLNVQEKWKQLGRQTWNVSTELFGRLQQFTCIYLEPPPVMWMRPATNIKRWEADSCQLSPCRERLVYQTIIWRCCVCESFLQICKLNCVVVGCWVLPSTDSLLVKDRRDRVKSLVETDAELLHLHLLFSFILKIFLGLLSSKSNH